MNQQAALNDGIFVIFGITGDLSKRKLLPALYRLAELDLLSERFRIVGTTRQQTQISDVLADINNFVPNTDPDVLKKLEGMLSMVYMNIAEPSDYYSLKDHLDTVEDEVGLCLNRLFYLATPPQLFNTIVESIGVANLQHGCQHNASESRLLVEKPFGHNTQSAIELINRMEQVFKERYIYRVDHYLAKETAQNILTFRMQNPVFKAVWNSKSIDYVSITAAESLGIEGRVNFYEQTGALRDLIQSHLLQLLALTTMEEPKEYTADAIHSGKLALLKAIKPISLEDVDIATVRGQYEGYTEEVNNPNSLIETYAAVQLEIDNKRWAGTPILLRTGKAMSKKVTDITMVFSDPDPVSTEKNVLTIRIQPNESIILSLKAKRPSLVNEVQTVNMEFDYDESFDGVQPDAYERVLVDAIRGDKTLFTTDEEVLTSWHIVDNILTAWAHDGASLKTYPKGSWGPSEADELAHGSGARWFVSQSEEDV